MPDPVKAPPEARVDELITEIGREIWEKYGSEPSRSLNDKHVRDTRMISELIRELAIAKAIIEIYENR